MKLKENMTKLCLGYFKVPISGRSIKSSLEYKPVIAWTLWVLHFLSKASGYQQNSLSTS